MCIRSTSILVLVLFCFNLNSCLSNDCEQKSMFDNREKFIRYGSVEKIFKQYFADNEIYPKELYQIILDYLKTETLKLQNLDSSNKFCALCPLSDGNIAIGTQKGQIYFLDSISGQYLKVLNGHNKAVTSLCVLQNGNLASGSTDSTIRIWNIKTGECLKVLSGYNTVTSLCSLHDSKLATDCDGLTIQILDTTGERLKTLDNKALLNSMCSLSENYFASHSSDNRIKIWDIETSQCLHSLECSAVGGSICTLKNGNLVANSRGKSGGANIIKIFNNDFTVFKEIETSGHIKKLYVLDDGNLVALSRDSLNIFDMQTGQCLMHKKFKNICDICQLSNGNLALGNPDEIIILSLNKFDVA